MRLENGKRYKTGNGFIGTFNTQRGGSVGWVGKIKFENCPTYEALWYESDGTCPYMAPSFSVVEEVKEVTMKIEVGKRYKDYENREYEIVPRQAQTPYQQNYGAPFIGHKVAEEGKLNPSGWAAFNSQGVAIDRQGHSIGSKYNLIKEVVKPLAIEIGKSYRDSDNDRIEIIGKDSKGLFLGIVRESKHKTSIDIVLKYKENGGSELYDDPKLLEEWRPEVDVDGWINVYPDTGNTSSVYKTEQSAQNGIVPGRRVATVRVTGKGIVNAAR